MTIPHVKRSKANVPSCEYDVTFRLRCLAAAFGHPGEDNPVKFKLSRGFYFIYSAYISHVLTYCCLVRII